MVYVDGSLLDESEADIRMVVLVVAEPMRYMFAAPSQEADQYTEGCDDLTADELDVVMGYMHNPMHDIMFAKGGKDETKWSEDASIASGAFAGNAFVRRVLDHWADQDEPRGGNPPTYGDIYQNSTDSIFMGGGVGAVARGVCFGKSYWEVPHFPGPFS